MKRSVLGVLLVLSLAVFGFSSTFSVKVNGGANFLWGGDYNAIIQGTNDYWHAQSGVTVSSDLSKLTLGLNFGAELIMNFTDDFGLGLGLGYITASSDSTLSIGFFGITQTWNAKPTASVVPITLNFHYFLPLSEAVKLHFMAGPGLYLSTFKFAIRSELGPGLWDLTETFTPDGKTVVGFQGGLGVEIALNPRLSLCVDVLGRAASMSELTGTYTVSGTVMGFPVSDRASNQTFYYFEADGYATYAIGASMPVGAGISNAREASVSLSGICALVGFRLKL